jgi:hypothetical protein
MIALVHYFEKVTLQASLKSAPDPEFLSKIYDFDVSAYPRRPWVASTSHITQI